MYVGVLAILVGVAYFEKLAMDNHWIGEAARVIQGAAAGLVMIGAGLRFRHKGLDLYGQMIVGCGLGILYLSTYAASTLYGLIAATPGLMLMVAITVAAAWLADSMRSQGLALLAAGGGFATPFLLGGPPRSEAALFLYDAVLIAGCVLIARRRGWRSVPTVGYVFTLFSVAAWAGRYYRPDSYLETEVFLTVFAALFLSVIVPSRREARRADVFGLILWTVVPAYYLASIAVLFDHQTALLAWLVIMMAAGAAVSAHITLVATLAVWCAVMLPLLVWAVTAHDWVVAGLSCAAAIYALALAALLRHEQAAGRRPSAAAIVLLHASGLGGYAAAYLLLYRLSLSSTAAVAAGFAVCNGAAGATLHTQRRELGLHFVALGATLLAIAVGIEFDAAWVSVGWAAEGVLLVSLGLHESRPWLRASGAALLLIAATQSMNLMAGPQEAHDVAFLNPGAAGALFVTASFYGAAWLYHRRTIAERAFAIGASLLLSHLLLLTLLTSELHRYWADQALAAEVSTSVLWAVFATVSIGVGLWRRYAPIRYFAMGLFALTSLKVFFVDMATLERVYRVASIIALGVLLLLTSYGYQKLRDRT